MTEEVDKKLLRSYEIAQKLGKGAYGVVWKGHTTRNQGVIALKKIFDAFQNATDAQASRRACAMVATPAASRVAA